MALSDTQKGVLKGMARRRRRLPELASPAVATRRGTPARANRPGNRYYRDHCELDEEVSTRDYSLPVLKMVRTRKFNHWPGWRTLERLEKILEDCIPETFHQECEQGKGRYPHADRTQQ